MGRKHRNQDEAFRHITSVGNDRKDLFIDDLDRIAFLRVLEKTSVRHEWDLGSYSLLGNHYHLSGMIPEGSMPPGMQYLNGVYSRAFNRRWKKSGHHLRERYDDRIVENESYLLNVIRYDVWNPVRHGFVENPADWKWSSYRATVGIVPAPKWLRVDLILREFSRNDGEARQQFRKFVQDGRDAKSPWDGRGTILGSDEFCESMTRRMEEAVRNRREFRPRTTAVDIVDAVAFALDLTTDAAKRASTGRMLASHLSLKRGVSLETVAEVFECSKATVSREAQRCADLAITDGEFNARLQKAKARLGHVKR